MSNSLDSGLLKKKAYQFRATGVRLKFIQELFWAVTPLLSPFARQHMKTNATVVIDG